MKSFNRAKVRFLAPAALALVAASARAQAPATLKFLNGDANGVSASISSPTYTSQTAGSLAGTGTLTITVGGKAVATAPSVSFAGITVDANGVATAGTLTFAQAAVLNALYGTDFDLKIAPGATATVGDNGGKHGLDLKGTLQGGLPFNDSKGNKVSVPLPGEVWLYEAGDLSVTATGATPSAASAVTGMTVDAAPANVSFIHAPGGAAVFSLTVPTATIHADLPGVSAVTANALTMTATNLVLDQDGPVSYTATTTGTAAQTVDLVSPLSFSLAIKPGASITVAARKVTAFSAAADVSLPGTFTDDAGKAVVLAGVGLQVGNGIVAEVKNATPINLKWNGFRISIPAATGNTATAILDLSSTSVDPAGLEKDPSGKALPASWRGFYLKAASLDLPALFSTAGGKAATISVSNFYIDGTGVTGGVGISDASKLTTIRVNGFAANLKSLNLQLLSNKVKSGNAAGSVTIPGWGGDVGLAVAFSTSGLPTVSADMSKPVAIPAFGAELQITNATFAPVGTTTDFSLTVSGGLKFLPTTKIKPLQGATVDVKDLSIDSKGNFSIGSTWVNLARPATLDLKVCSLSASQFGFGKVAATDSDTAHRGLYWVGLTGGIKLSDDLPVTGQVAFDGLKVFAKPNGNGGFSDPDFTFGGISVDATVAKVASIKGKLNLSTFDVTYPNGTKTTVDCLRGSADLTLDALKGGRGLGASLDFMTAKNSWYVMGTANMSPGIALGQSGLAIFGFRGGLGHNVMPDPKGPQTGVPVRDYTLVPDVSAMSAGRNNWLVCAGLRMGTVDGFTAWGDITLTMGFPQFMVNLNGKLYLLQSGSGSSTPPDDRTVTGNITYVSSTDTFDASLYADLYFPSRSTNLLEAWGGMNLHISPNSKYFRIGGPIHPDFNNRTVWIENPLGFAVAGTRLAGGALTVDYNGGAINAQAAIQLGFSQSWSSGPAHLDISLNGCGYVQVGFNGTSFQGGTAFARVDGNVHAYADLKIWHPSANAGVSASLGGSIDSNYHISLSGTATASISLAHVATIHVSRGFTYRS